MPKKSIILIAGQAPGSLFFVTNIVKGGKKGDAATHIGELEGFTVNTVPKVRSDGMGGYVDDVEVIKRQVIWTKQGGSYSEHESDDITGTHLDFNVINYILSHHKQRQAVEAPKLFRFLNFLGQPQVSIITPNFRPPQTLQADIFSQLAERGETQKILQNRKEHRFWLSQAHLSNLHVCETDILSGEILFKVLPYRQKT